MSIKLDNGLASAKSGKGCLQNKTMDWFLQNPENDVYKTRQCTDIKMPWSPDEPAWHTNRRNRLIAISLSFLAMLNFIESDVDLLNFWCCEMQSLGK